MLLPPRFVVAALQKAHDDALKELEALALFPPEMERRRNGIERRYHMQLFIFWAVILVVLGAAAVCLRFTP